MPSAFGKVCLALRDAVRQDVVDRVLRGLRALASLDVLRDRVGGVLPVERRVLREVVRKAVQ